MKVSPPVEHSVRANIEPSLVVEDDAEAVAPGPRRILGRSVLLLIVVVGLPSVIYNLKPVVPNIDSMQKIEGHVVAVVSGCTSLAWLCLCLYFVGLYRRSWRTEPRFATVLVVLMLDAFRNVIESAYFGLAFSSSAHHTPNLYERLLWEPQVIIVSRLLALSTAAVILWLVLERGFENLKLREGRSLLLEQRNRELNALQQLVALVSGSLETENVLNSVCREVVDTLLFQSALLCLVDPPAGVIRAAAGCGVESALITDTERSLDGPDILADIVRTGKTEILTGWDPRFHKETYERYSHAGQMRVFAPIQDGANILGVVEITVKPGAPIPDQHRIELLHSFLRHASTAIRNARLHQQVLTDRERLNLLTRSLEDKNRQLEGFVYMISHDLKAPLVSIQGFLSLMTQECAEGLGDDGRFYLDRVRSNAEHLQGLIQQLLELSRVGRVEGLRTRVDLGDLASDIAATLSPQLSAAGIELIIRPNLPTAFVEPVQMRQLLLNLIDNAIKYMGLSEERRITVYATETEESLELVVQDTGVGIPTDLQERVFLMFQRVPSTGVTIEGNGVGLAIVRKITEGHGGQVWVNSAGVGHGSSFHVLLPKNMAIDTTTTEG